MYERPGERLKYVGKISFVVRHFETLMAGNKWACSVVFETCQLWQALAGSNLTVRDSRTSDRSAQSRFFFKMADQAKSLTRGVESWNGNSRFKRHHIERKEVRGFEAICACHFAVKYLKYTIKFLRWEREDWILKEGSVDRSWRQGSSCTELNAVRVKYIRVIILSHVKCSKLYWSRDNNIIMRK